MRNFSSHINFPFLTYANKFCNMSSLSLLSFLGCLNKCSLWYIKGREIERKIENLSHKEFIFLRLMSRGGVCHTQLLSLLCKFKPHPFYVSLSTLNISSEQKNYSIPFLSLSLRWCCKKIVINKGESANPHLILILIA